MPQGIKQNTIYTFKYNLSMGRHGWLRLTPAYSVRLVEEILESLTYTPKGILEPFSGTGTTELVAGNIGLKAYAFEVNPFLVWLGNTKIATYAQTEIDEFQKSADKIITSLNDFAPSEYPNIFHIERWWGQRQLEFLSKIKSGITAVENSKIQDLLKVAFCRTLIEISNAAFNHVSTSFTEKAADDFEKQSAIDFFLSVCSMIAKTAKIQPTVTPTVYHCDSKKIPFELTNAFDTVITSPPYPNRISYIRELRPYMYWLDFLSSSEQASVMDWNTIGGTWGSATSRLSTWTCDDTQLPSYLYDIVGQINRADNKSAPLMANYVHKYFNDMAIHIKSVYEKLSKGGQVFYIVGNSSFYGVTVPSEILYADIMTSVGFNNATYKIVRKRNCKKCLYEYVISAEK